MNDLKQRFETVVKKLNDIQAKPQGKYEITSNFSKNSCLLFNDKKELLQKDEINKRLQLVFEKLDKWVKESNVDFNINIEKEIDGAGNNTMGITLRLNNLLEQRQINFSYSISLLNSETSEGRASFIDSILLRIRPIEIFFTNETTPELIIEEIIKTIEDYLDSLNIMEYK